MPKKIERPTFPRTVIRKPNGKEIMITENGFMIDVSPKIHHEKPRKVGGRIPRGREQGRIGR